MGKFWLTSNDIRNRFNNRPKLQKRMSSKRSWQILQQQQVQEHKNVTPKFEDTITHTYGALEGDYEEL